MACLSPTRIPKKLIYDLLLEYAHYQKSDVTQALVLLCDYSLIQDNKQYFSVHRVVQDAIRKQLEMREEFEKVLVHLVRLFDPYLNSFPLDLKVNRNILNNAEHLMSNFLLNKLDIIHILKFVSHVSWSMRDTRSSQAEQNLKRVLLHTAKLKTVDDGMIFELRNRLVHILDSNGKYKEAKALCDLTKQRFGDRFSSSHPLQLYCQENLAHLKFCHGDYEKAGRIYSYVYNNKDMMLGANHTQTIKVGRCIGSMFRLLGRLLESEKILSRTLERAKRRYGKDDTRFLKLKQRYALTLHDLGKYVEAEELFSTVLQAQERIIGHMHKDTLTTKNGLAQTLIYTGCFEKALILLFKVYKSRRNILDPGHHDIIATSINLSLAFTGLGKYVDALKYIGIAVREGSKNPGRNHPYTTVARIVHKKIKNLELLKLQTVCLTTEVFNLNFVIPNNPILEVHDQRIVLPNSVGIAQVLLFDSVSATYGVQDDNAHLHVTWAKLTSGEVVKNVIMLNISQKLLIIVQSPKKVPLQNVQLELVDVKTKNVVSILPRSWNKSQTRYHLQLDVNDSPSEFNQIIGHYEMALCLQHSRIRDCVKWNIGRVYLNKLLRLDPLKRKNARFSATAKKPKYGI